ncbi:MAG: hypothetical protein K2L83_05505 [Muribaculaceae bacterium]|nr:hypothetical protein [Muribaculaceae bacterium]MDE6330151.1 hypothetical protein [Muribaculaceae bacterium]
MTKDSAISTIAVQKSSSNKSPRNSTVNFIRQFSRSYVVVAGLAINGMICN